MTFVIRSQSPTFNNNLRQPYFVNPRQILVLPYHSRLVDTNQRSHFGMISKNFLNQQQNYQYFLSLNTRNKQILSIKKPFQKKIKLVTRSISPKNKTITIQYKNLNCPQFQKHKNSNFHNKYPQIKISYSQLNLIKEKHDSPVRPKILDKNNNIHVSFKSVKSATSILYMEHITTPRKDEREIKNWQQTRPLQNSIDKSLSQVSIDQKFFDS